jgi:addiction module HigA family antidote
MAMYNPAHPGRILQRYVEGNNLSVAEAAKRLGVARVSLSRLLHGHAGVSAEMAIRIGKTFGTDPGLWVRMQGQYDLWQASRRHIKVHPVAKAKSSPSTEEAEHARGTVHSKQEAIALAKRMSPAPQAHTRRPARVAARSTQTIPGSGIA